MDTGEDLVRCVAAHHLIGALVPGSPTPMTTRRRGTFATLLTAFALIAAVVVQVSASPAGAQTAAPVDWGDLDTTDLELIGTFAPSTPVGDLVFTLGLTGDVAGLEAYARSVSDPSSPTYGERMSVAELADRFGASTATIDAVTGYFTGLGIEVELDPTGTYAMVFMTDAEAASVFSTGGWTSFEYPAPSFYTAANGVEFVYPAAQPTLPAALVGHVDRVDGLVFPYTGVPSSDDAVEPIAGPSPTPGEGSPGRTGTAQGCAGAMGVTISGLSGPAGLMPNQLNTAYQLDQLHARGLQGQGMRVAIIDDGLYDPTWLSTYRSCFGLDDATPVTDHIVGDDPTGEPTETILDLSVMSFAAPYVDRFDVFIADTTINDEVDDIIPGLVRMFASPLDASRTGGEAPDVISASFGACEISPLNWHGRSAAVSIMEQILATAAAAGITYVNSTGDSGASGCFAQFKVATPELEALAVQYPASSQWVTAVGGTNLALNDDNSIRYSGVWNDNTFFGLPTGMGGTGGTSTMIERPWYQAESVGPGSMRTVPDVSLFADPYPGYPIFQGSWSVIGGTSAATPLFGAMVLLLGQEARATGQHRLGFLNPLLYELGRSGGSGAAAILDITAGNNDTIATNCCDATPGYDLASGWGSPLAQRMSQVLAPPTVQLTGVGSTDGSFTARFTAEVIVPAGQVVTYEWDLTGDGVTDHVTTTPSVTTTAAAAGAQAARVTVVTDLGRTAVAGTSVEVTPATVPVAQAPRGLAFVG